MHTKSTILGLSCKLTAFVSDLLPKKGLFRCQSPFLLREEVYRTLVSTLPQLPPCLPPCQRDPKGMASAPDNSPPLLTERSPMRAPREAQSSVSSLFHPDCKLTHSKAHPVFRFKVHHRVTSEIIFTATTQLVMYPKSKEHGKVLDMFN